MYKGEVNFTHEEIISNLVELTGMFPMSLVVPPEMQKKLAEKYVPPISEWDASLGVCWFIPRSVKKKKTKNGKAFYVVSVIDSNNETNNIRCWGVNPERDLVFVNRPYMARLNFDPQWGFSTRSVRKMFKLLA